MGYQHAHEPVPPLRDKAPLVSAEVEAVVMKALAKDLHQRFVTVQAFATALEHACQTKSSVAVPPQKAIKQFYDSGEKHRLAGRYNEALADFDQALALDSSLNWVKEARDEVRRQMR